jgi:23S rRNA pseudouridine1911/1915/1917 synthase
VFHFEKNIVYHDNHILVAYKPAGMLSQKDRTGEDSILEHAKQYIKEAFQKPGEVFLGSIHRLDRPAEGLMVFARTSKALTRMNAMWQRGEVGKSYLALLSGHPSLPVGKLVDYLKKDTETNTVRRFDRPGPGRKRASLNYRVLAGKQGISLVSIDLETGRPHQIRVQFAGIGCPVVGDMRYGEKRTTPDRSICLLSQRLQFIHPVSRLPMDFSVDLPTEREYWILFRDFSGL